MKSQVEKHSEEWNAVHYRIQLILGLPATQPIKIFKFNSCEMELEELGRRYPNKTILEGHLNISNLDQSTQRKLIQKKTKMSNLIVETGRLSTQIDPKQNKKYSLWLLKAAVGDSYYIQTSTGMQIPSNVPQGYDSLYLSSNQLYTHDYILREPDQYALQYEVLYTFEKERQYNARQIVCDKCQRRSAVAYCKQEQAFFCSQCNIIHHRDKLLSSHVRQQLTKFNTIDLCKQSNHNKRLQLFCQTCLKTICIQCTISGWHSTKEFANHQTVALKKYYDEKLFQNQDLTKIKKSELIQNLRKIDELIKQNDMHTYELEKRIIQMYESTLRDLRENAKAKLDKLLIIKIQTKRQHDQLIWTNSYIKYQQQLLKPSYYLEAQQQYQKFKEQFNRIPLKHIPKLNLNNLQIEGEIKLVQVDHFYKKQPYELEQSKYSKEKQYQKPSINGYNSKSISSNQNSKKKRKSSSQFNHIKDLYAQQAEQFSQEKHIFHSKKSSGSKILGSSAAPILMAKLKDAGLTSIKFE